MPSLLSFDSSVCRGIPSLAAAPEGPEMRPWDSANAVLIISTSRCANAGRPFRPSHDSVGGRLNQPFINRERVPFAQNDASLHHVLQFANVSGPSVAARSE